MDKMELEWYKIRKSRNFVDAFFKVCEMLGYGYFHTCLIYADWSWKNEKL